MTASIGTSANPASTEKDKFEKMASPSLTERDALTEGAKDLGDGLVQSDFHVPAMHCAGCLRKIEKGLEAHPHIGAARANLSTKRVSVQWRPDASDGKLLTDTITELGFENYPFDLGALDSGAEDKVTKRLALSVGVAGFGAANIMLLSVSVWSGADDATRQMFHLLSGLIAIPVVAYSGQVFFASALKAIRAWRLNMDVPISVAVLLALSMSLFESLNGGEHAYFDASVTLLFFLLIGRTLDHMMREKARGAISRLSRLAAKSAMQVAPDGSMFPIALKDIAPGMDILVRAGERIPVDGHVSQGASDLDRSLVTGESLPVSVKSGDPVEAGTLNLTGPLQIGATKTAATSFLAEIVSMMEAAEQGKATYSRIADRAAAIYAPAVHLVALVTFIGWMFYGGDWHHAIMIAISVLIITCPCALGLAVPIVHVVAANRLLKQGIMVKDGAALEKLNEIDIAIFDKTGTLTLGTPKVAAQDGAIAEALGHRICALAARSTHPASKAVSAYLSEGASAGNQTSEGNAESIDLACLQEVPGSGIAARVGDIEMRLGRFGWAVDCQRQKATGLKPNPHCNDVVYADSSGTLIGFALQDILRPGAVDTITALKDSGLDVMILSGDNPNAVRGIATSLGISDYRSEQTPSEKIAIIEDLREQGRTPLMVGDGLNDAPALAAGHVSMAPSSGSDVGRLAADLVFMSERLDVIPFARTIAMRTDRLVKQNFALALIYNCIAIPLAVLGYATPLVAAIAMSASSIVVIANSMRLSRGTRIGRNTKNRGAEGVAPALLTSEAAS